MDHMDLYDFAHCGFAQLRMIAAGDTKEEGTALPEILRGIASAQEISGKMPVVEKTRELMIPMLELGSKSLSAATRLQTVNIVKSLSSEWGLELQEIREKLAVDKRKSVRDAALGLKT